MVLLVLNEPALYETNGLADFRPPYAVRDDGHAKFVASYAPKIIREQLASAAHNVLEQVLTYSTESLREIPAIIYIRMMHAAVILVKLHSSLTEPIYQFSSISDVFDRILQKLDLAACGRKYHVPRLFRFILLQLNQWQGSRGRGHDSGLIQPLMSLDDENLHTPPPTPFISSGYSRDKAANKFTILRSHDTASSPLTIDAQHNISEDVFSTEILGNFATSFIEQMLGNGAIEFTP